ARKLQQSTRRNGPPLGNCKNYRAGAIHLSENAESHALECSIAQKMQNPTRWKGPSLGNSEIPRAGEIHHSENAEFHALERSIAQKSKKLTRWNYLMIIKSKLIS